LEAGRDGNGANGNVSGKVGFWLALIQTFSPWEKEQQSEGSGPETDNGKGGERAEIVVPG